MDIQTVTAQCAWIPFLLLYQIPAQWTIPLSKSINLPAQWTLLSSKSINLPTNQLGIQV